MTSLIPLIVLAAAAVIGAAICFNIWAAIAVAAAAWLFLTWWQAPDSVTFKKVLLALLEDIRDLLALRQIWAWAVKVWRFCGEAFGAALITLDVYITATPELKMAVSSTQWGLPVLIAVNFLAFIARSASRAPAHA